MPSASKHLGPDATVDTGKGWSSRPHAPPSSGSRQRDLVIDGSGGDGRPFPPPVLPGVGSRHASRPGCTIRVSSPPPDEVDGMLQ
jgi:hypothetical protein